MPTHRAIPLKRRIVREDVMQQLQAMIQDQGLVAGDRLASMRQLARQMKVSLPTMQRVLDQLQADGLVEKRPGSGVYVTDQRQPMTLQRCVALCSESSGHVWGGLTSELMQWLHDRQLTATLFDTSVRMTPDHFASMLTDLQHSDVLCMLVHGHEHFAFDALLKTQQASRRPMIALVDWACSQVPDGLVRVLSDSRKGGKLAAEHLLELGHRRVLVVGPEGGIARFYQAEKFGEVQQAFRKTWEAAGGQWETCHGRARDDDGTIELDTATLARVMRSNQPPTAVLGLMDVAACDALHQIRRLAPKQAEKMAFVGYFDTPWARASYPAMTSISLDIPTIVGHVCSALEAIIRGEDLPFSLKSVAPKLVIRETSRPLRA